MEGEYGINAIPIEKKTWREADKVAVVLSVDVGSEKRVFKGVLTLKT